MIVTFYIAIVLLLVGVNFRGGGWWRPDRCLMIRDHINKKKSSPIFSLSLSLWNHFSLSFWFIHKCLDDIIACCLSQYELCILNPLFLHQFHHIKFILPLTLWLNKGCSFSMSQQQFFFKSAHKSYFLWDNIYWIILNSWLSWIVDHVRYFIYIQEWLTEASCGLWGGRGCY